ncbi:phosphopantetheine-binding protein [Streptomyces sp. DSM 41921]|uniref:Phosphopantetheine-binding protein n=1 Tax=Streptomyces dubilierae TaxID=3075533 RepID=A0ABU2PCF0_9ACTN|nr:phosphopantetheine-binding protein [Streptomyces sp. DSM 41921]MDT0389512.1 phosphopantetheine-binding protein [Streptomyces sp. DSM 41921]
MPSEALTDIGNDAAAHTAASIRNYVRSNMSALRDAELRDDDNIFEKGFVTSIFAMQMLDFIESTFGVEVPDDRITLQNFSSVDSMTRMVGELKHAADR